MESDASNAMTVLANWKASLLLSLAALLAGISRLSPAEAATNYLYDPTGRLTVAIYDSGVCIAYAYDANGDRTSVTTFTGPPVAAKLIWGTGNWGCTTWSSN
jgi:YD repeat-containing protein